MGPTVDITRSTILSVHRWRSSERRLPVDIRTKFTSASVITVFSGRAFRGSQSLDFAWSTTSSRPKCLVDYGGSTCVSNAALRNQRTCRRENPVEKRTAKNKNQPTSEFDS